MLHVTVSWLSLKHCWGRLSLGFKTGSLGPEYLIYYDLEECATILNFILDPA